MARIGMKGVAKSFGDKKVLKSVTFDASGGEIFGLLGPSGSGKTTIINILTGQLAADSGELFVSDSEIGLVMEHEALFSRLSVLDNLLVFGKIHKIPKARCLDALERVGLLGERKTPARKISRGMRQRLMLARAVLHEPKILFLDEPTSALDPLTARGIHQLIRELKEGGATVFLTTHNMEEATHLCDRVVMLHGGGIIEQGSPKEICQRYNATKTAYDLESVFVQLTGGGIE